MNLREFRPYELLFGFVILIITFVLLHHSNANMMFSQELVVRTSAFLLLSLFVDLLILSQIPHHGKLRLLTRDDKLFESSYEIIFVSIYFCLATIIVGLLANGMQVDRAQNILFLSMFITTCYNTIICVWITHSFLRMSGSVDKENPIHKSEMDKK